MNRPVDYDRNHDPNIADRPPSRIFWFAVGWFFGAGCGIFTSIFVYEFVTNFTMM